MTEGSSDHSAEGIERAVRRLHADIDWTFGSDFCRVWNVTIRVFETWIDQYKGGIVGSKVQQQMKKVFKVLSLEGSL